MAYLGARKSGYEMRRLGVRQGGFSGLPADDGSTIGSASGDYSTPAGLTFTELSANGDGTYQTVGSGASDGRYNGTYTLSAEQYADLTNEGITWLRLADITESPTDTFTADGQLWIWDEDQTPEFSAQWFASGITALGTGDTYARHAADTRALTYVQTGKVPSGEAVAATPVTAAAAGVYAQNFIRTNGAANLEHDDSAFILATSASDKATFSGWYKFRDQPTGKNFAQPSGVRFSWAGSNIRLRITDDVGGDILDVRFAGPALDALTHIALSVDLAVPEFTLLVNGVEPTITTTSVAMNAGNGLLERTDMFVFGDNSTVDMEVSDFIYEHGAILDLAALYNSGTPPRVTDITTTAQYHLGGVMKADADQFGDTDKGWSDKYNLGTAGTLTTVTGSLTDVV